jgi:hypothetical protein
VVLIFAKFSGTLHNLHDGADAMILPYLSAQMLHMSCSAISLHLKHCMLYISHMDEYIVLSLCSLTFFTIGCVYRIWKRRSEPDPDGVILN